jgi:hypothetical protein
MDDSESVILDRTTHDPRPGKTENAPTEESFSASPLSRRRTVRSPPYWTFLRLPEQGVSYAGGDRQDAPASVVMLSPARDCIVTQTAAENHHRYPPSPAATENRHRPSPAGAASGPQRRLSRSASVTHCQWHLARAGMGMARCQAAGPAASGIRDWLASCPSCSKVSSADRGRRARIPAGAVARHGTRTLENPPSRDPNLYSSIGSRHADTRRAGGKPGLALRLASFPLTAGAGWRARGRKPRVLLAGPRSRGTRSGVSQPK